MELAGGAPGAQFDQVHASGQLALNGTLQVSLIDGFAPSIGQAFDILDWGALSGTFAPISLPAGAGGRRWDSSQLYTTGVLSVLPGFETDFDEDGDVDGAYLVSWRGGVGASGGDSHAG